MDTKKDAKNNKRIAVIATVVFNSLVIAFLIFTIAWRPPDPPIPQFGIEVNFGMDDVGSGDLQSRAPANESESLDEARQDVPEPAEPEPQPQQPAEQPEPVQDVQQEVVAAADESEESVEAVPEEQVEEKPKEVSPEPEKAESKPVEEPPKEEEKPKVNSDALLGGGGTSNENKANNNGNKKGVGDMGDPQGNVNADALLGSNTGKGGSSLDMPGWKWDSPPQVNDQSNITGKITFEVKIDDAGEVISVERKYSTIADRTVINKYKNAVYDLTFNTLDPGIQVPRVTTGNITFVITSR